MTETIKKDVAELFNKIKNGKISKTKTNHQNGEITETIAENVIKKYGMQWLKKYPEKYYDFCKEVKNEISYLNSIEPQNYILTNNFSGQQVKCSKYIHDTTIELFHLYNSNDLGCNNIITVLGIQSGKIDHTDLVDKYDRLRGFVREIDHETYYAIID